MSPRFRLIAGVRTRAPCLEASFLFRSEWREVVDIWESSFVYLLFLLNIVRLLCLWYVNMLFFVIIIVGIIFIIVVIIYLQVIMAKIC